MLYFFHLLKNIFMAKNAKHEGSASESIVVVTVDVLEARVTELIELFKKAQMSLLEQVAEIVDPIKKEFTELKERVDSLSKLQEVEDVVTDYIKRAGRLSKEMGLSVDECIQRCNLVEQRVLPELNVVRARFEQFQDSTMRTLDELVALVGASRPSVL
jgi:2-succinyl-5-enolpyruvyl-6-hydroxy-3-cyclohexene-1-carboxylate synthase